MRIFSRWQGKLWPATRLETANPSSGVNPAIQVFRGISIAIVVLFHYTSRTPNEVLFQNGAKVTTLFSFGWIGVYLFFVISGYSIYGSLIRSSDPGHFLAKRVARILPPFVAASTLIFVFLQFVSVPSFRDGGWSFNVEKISILDYVMTTFFLARDLGFNWVDGVFWTLLVEIKFYFLITLLHAFGLTRNFNAVALTCGFALPSMWLFANFAEYHSAEIVLRVVLLAPYWPFFLLGMFLFHFRAVTGQVLGLSLTAIVCLFIIGAVKPSPVENHFVSVIAFISLLILMIHTTLQFDRPNRHSADPRFTFIVARPFIILMIFVGNYSYSWYLLHQKIGMAIVRWASASLSPILAVSLAAASTLLLAYGFSRAIEYRYYKQVMAFTASLIERSRRLVRR